VIPADVRGAYGKREEKPTWPASLTQGQARAEFGVWLAGVEDRIASLRSFCDGPSVDLSERQSAALAGKWYCGLEARYGDNPGSEDDWDIAYEAICPEETEESYQAYVRGDDRPYEGPWRITPYLETELAILLDGEQLKIAPRAAERLLQDMAGLYGAFCQLMQRRANGDFGADTLPERFPTWLPAVATLSPQMAPVAGPSITGLFEGYVAERKPSPATVKAWKRFIAVLVDFSGHDDASRVTADDIVRWKEHLLTEPNKSGNLRSARTVRETYLAAAKAVFGWGKENRRITDNPATGITVRGEKRKRLRDAGFTNDEALTILRATLQPVTAKISRHHVLARRWVPWLCAYSGARVNEMTQLRKKDIICQDGVWAMNITPEAGGVKTNEARLVPLHSHLVDQGFLKFVEGASDGPLFYDPKGHRGGTAGNPHYKKVGERLASWVRSLGVTDENVAPNHGWRHRFKTVARGARMDPEARAVIPGHAPKTEGEAYGSWPLDQLAFEIERLPRIDVGPAQSDLPTES
jgi:integrase